MAPHTRYFILAILVLGFANGAADVFLFPGQHVAPYGFTVAWGAMPSLFLTFMWYRRDSDSRGFRRSPVLSGAIIAFAILALPYYLFRTRGLRGGALGTLAIPRI